MPAAGYRRPDRLDATGLVVSVIGTDGQEAGPFDFSQAPTHGRVRQELISAFVNRAGGEVALSRVDGHRAPHDGGVPAQSGPAGDQRHHVDRLRSRALVDLASRPGGTQPLARAGEHHAGPAEGDP